MRYCNPIELLVPFDSDESTNEQDKGEASDFIRLPKTFGRKIVWEYCVKQGLVLHRPRELFAHRENDNRHGIYQAGQRTNAQSWRIPCIEARDDGQPRIARGGNRVFWKAAKAMCANPSSKPNLFYARRSCIDGYHNRQLCWRDSKECQRSFASRTFMEIGSQYGGASPIRIPIIRGNVK